MTDDEALTPRLTVIGAVNRAAGAEPGDQERTTVERETYAAAALPLGCTSAV